LPATTVNGGEDRHRKVPFSELQKPHYLDLGSGHMAYRRASVIGPLCTYQISLKSEKCYVDGKTYGRRPTY